MQRYNNSFNDSSAQRIPANKMVYDGKRMRKAITRRTVDFNASILRGLQAKSPFERNSRGERRTIIQPHPDYLVNLMTPAFRQNDPIASVPTKFVHASANKVRSPVQVARWTPEGRRMLTGCSSGEMTFWNGSTFNFETILQAHDTAVKAMTWSHNGNFLLSGDQMGCLKFWLPSLNNLKILPLAHKESVRSICFSPSDAKFATCADDGMIKIWDFAEAAEERLLQGHGWDVRCIDWHPYKSLLASGSKDNLIKLWDPKSGQCLSTIHGHKNSITDLKWNKNGNWLASTGRDQVIKLFDLRMMREFMTFKGHSKEINTLAWHPVHEGLLASGGGDGAIMFWSAQHERSLGQLLGAHEGLVLSLDWHPLGYCLASGSLDTSVKFWIRQRPADSGLDPYILGQRAAEAMGIKAAEPVISVADDDAFWPGGAGGEEGAIPGMHRSRPGRGGYHQRDFRDNRDRPDSRDYHRGDSRDYGDRERRDYRDAPRDNRDYRDAPRDNRDYRDAPRDNRPPPPPPPPPSRY